MLRVPTVDLRPADEVEVAAPNVIPRQDATGAQLQQLGQGLSRAGQGLLEVAVEEQDFIDNAEAHNRLNALRTAVQSSVGDFSNLLGQAAVKEKDAALRRLAKTREDIEGSLGNSVQAQLFGPRADYLMSAALGDIEAHWQKQSRAYEDGELAASVKGGIDTAARYARQWQGPEFAVAKGLVERDAARRADVLQLPSDSAQRKQLVADAVQSLHGRALDTLLSQDPQGAREYFARFRGEFGGLTEAAERSIARATDKEVALRTAREVSLSGLSPLDQLAELDRRVGLADADPQRLSEEQLDGARRELLSRMQEQETARVAEAAALRREAESALSRDLATPSSAGPRPARTLDQLYSPGQLERFRDLGILDGLRQYEADGRWSTSSEGFAKLGRVRPEHLQGRPWDHVENEWRFDLSNHAMGQLREMWGKVNTPSKIDLDNPDWAERNFLRQQLARLPGGELPVDPSKSELRVHEDRVESLKTAMLQIGEAKGRKLSRQDVIDFVGAQLSRSVEPVGGGGDKTAMMFVPPDGKNAFQVVYQDPRGNSFVVELQELDVAETHAQARAVVAARAEAFAASKLPQHRRTAAELRMALDQNDPQVLAYELARSRAEASEAARAAEAKTKAAELQAKQQAATEVSEALGKNEAPVQAQVALALSTGLTPEEFVERDPLRLGWGADPEAKARALVAVRTMFGQMRGDVAMRSRAEEASIEVAWNEFLKHDSSWVVGPFTTGRWALPGGRAARKALWIGSERARRENAARWPGDTTFSFGRWHGLASKWDREDPYWRLGQVPDSRPR